MFLEPNFPFVQLPPPASHAAYGYPAGPGGPGRRVKIDFSQSAHPPDARRGRGELGGRLAINDGTRDIGSAHAPVVLLRGLDFNSSVKDVEEALRGAEGVGKVGAQGMVRILVIMNKSMKKNWGFAFVEFIDVTVSGRN
jgi:RNA-binding protein 5/10